MAIFEFSDSRLRKRTMALEREARNSPCLHALRLSCYIAIGYFWPLVLLVMCAIGTAVVLSLFMLAWDEVGVQGVFVWLVLLGATPFALYVLIGAMVQKSSALPGQRISPQDAPELFALIEQVRAASGSPMLQQVNLDHQSNARTVLRRRSGIWGRTRYSLVLGVPLMAALTPEHLRAVLAHEFGHTTGEGDRFAAWVNRVVRTWADMVQSQEGKPTVYGRLLGWFARWYVPWLLRSTLAVRKLHEYAADRASAAVVGPENAASALAALVWAEHRLGRSFIAGLWHETVQSELPPGDYMQRVIRFMATEVDPQWVTVWRAIELRRRGRVVDEHPALIERIIALDAAQVLQAPQDGYAADGVRATIAPEASALSLLGPCREKAICRANAMWKAQVIASWRNEHRIAVELAKEGEDQSDASPGAVADREWWDLQADLRYCDPIAALQLIREYLCRHPEHPEANYDMGRLLLAEEDDAGRAFLEAAIAGDSDWTFSALRLLLNYYRDAGRDQEADEVAARWRTYEAAVKSHRKHAGRLGRSERLLPHDLKPRQLRELWLCINRVPHISRAYLAMRGVRVISDKPVYVLAVEPGSLMQPIRPRVARAIAQSMPVPCTVVVLRWWKRRLRDRIEAVCPAPVFEDLQPPAG
jgi:Zn-dependent protease with chaperone function